MPIAAVVLAGLATASSLPAAGVTPFNIRGTVRDALGRPMGDAIVDDGVNEPVATAADGTYVLAESSTGKYELNADRADADKSASVNVDASVPFDVVNVDFVLKYEIRGTMAHTSMATVHGAQARTLDVFTRAPQPGQPGGAAGTSCVYVTDSRSGVTGAATYVSTGNGEAKWAYDVSVPRGAPEGIYDLTYEAKDCSSATSMTSIGRTPYVVDNSAPKLDLGLLFPGDSANALAVPQPIIAKITDSASGVLPSTLSLEVKNLADNSTTTFASTSLTYNPRTGIVKTNIPVSLAQTTRYKVRLSASDLVGNAMSETWHFRTITVNASAAKSQIAGTSGKFVGTKTSNRWEFVPELEVGQTTVAYSAVEHSGFGNVTQVVPLSAAQITYEIAGVASPTTVSPYLAGATTNVQTEFTALAEDGAAVRQVLGTQVKLNPVTVELPLSATNPKLTMAPVLAVPSLPAQLCLDPTTALAGCTSDPLRFWVAEDLANQAFKDIDQPAMQAGEPVLPAMLTHLLNFSCVTTFGDDGTWYSSAPTCIDVGIPPHWEPLLPARSIVSVNDVPFVAGVSYPGTMAPRTPEQYAEACDIGYPCVSNRAALTGTASTGYLGSTTIAAAFANDDVRRKCVFVDGYNRPNKNCNQEIIISLEPPRQSGLQRVSAYWLSQVGTADNTAFRAPPEDYLRRPYPNDGFAMSWYNDSHQSDVNQKWHFHNNSNQFRSVVEEAYWHFEGDIADSSSDPNWGRWNIPAHRWTNWYSTMSGQNSIAWNAGVDPAGNGGWGYGVSMPYSRTNPIQINGASEYATTSVQYQSSCGTALNRGVNPYTGYYCSATNGGTGVFNGYYNPDAGVYMWSREGLARAVSYSVQGDVSATNPAEAGWVVLRWGHVFREYSVQWLPGWGVSFPGGWGFGWTLTPKDEQKERTSEWAFRYCFGGASC